MALLRYPASRSDCVSRAWTGARHREAPLVLLNSSKGSAAKAGASYRVRDARFAAWRKDSVCRRRGTGKEFEEAGGPRKKSGHAIFAKEFDSLHFAGGCGN